MHIFLQTYGVTTSQCVKLVNKYGPAARQVITDEPYRVAREIEGIGFKTADRIAINLGYANDAPPRLDAGLIYALEILQEEGHTAYPRGELVGYAATLLETSAELLEARIDALLAAKAIVQHEGGTRPPGGFRESAPQVSLPGGQAPPRTPNPRPETRQLHDADFLQLPPNDRAERKIADVVRRLDSVPSGLPAIKIEPAIAWAQEKAKIDFHPLQRAALTNALAHKFSILTGGPGTGKTTILRALVEILKAKKVRVHLAAPTGRAAQRLAETTGGYASTIHRLLKFEGVKGVFTVNESSPLATDFLIVDEASMLDSRLAAALLQSVPVRAHLLLVGDTDQLPSVGAGNVLKDLISAGGAATTPRSAVMVPGRANPPDEPRLLDPLGAPSAPAQGLSLSNGLSQSKRLVGTTRPTQTLIPVTRLSVVYRQKEQSLIVTLAHAINGGESSPPPVVNEVSQAQAWSDLNFIAAASPEDCLKKIIELCTKFIPQHFNWFHPVNDVQVLAPMHKGVAGVANLNAQLQAALNPSRQSLKTVSGEYRPGDKLIQLRNNYDKDLFNGDIGEVLAIDGVKGTLTAVFDGAKHTFERGEFGDLGLAYAISIHKSQGSEYPVVIVPLLKAHFVMLQRNLIYTAITRGRKKVFIVGEPAAYGMAVRNAESKLRCTHLREKILAATL